MNTINTPFRNLPSSKLFFTAILLAGAIAHALLSPKWVQPVFAWVAPACMLFYYRHATLKLKTLWFIIAVVVSQTVSAFDVFPFPAPVIIVLTLINTCKLLVVFFRVSLILWGVGYFCGIIFCFGERYYQSVFTRGVTLSF